MVEMIQALLWYFASWSTERKSRNIFPETTSRSREKLPFQSHSTVNLLLFDDDKC